MAISAFLLASVIPVLKATAEITSKEKIDDIGLFTVSLFSRVTGIPILMGGLYVRGVPQVSLQFWTALSVSVPLGVLATLSYIKALEVSDLSFVSPLSSISPILLIMTGFIFLGEVPSLYGFFGMIFIVIGVYVLNVSKSTSKANLLDPFMQIKNNKSVKYIGAMIVIYSITAPIDKIGVEASSPLLYTAGLYIGLSIGLFIPMVQYSDTWKQNCREHYKTLSVIGICNSLASIAQMVAFTLTLVIYVISIKRIGIIFSVMYGTIVKNEGLTTARITGTIIIITGVTLISITI